MYRPYTLLKTLAGVLLMTIASAGSSAEVTGPTPFGKTAGGEAVELYTLKNANGMIVKIMTRGGTITELHVPDKNGKSADVTLGFDTVAGYESADNQHFGCITGRVANRIAKAKFTLDGKEYQLALNNGPNHLHGGTKKSLDKIVWKAEKGDGGKSAAVSFSYSSPAGEEGYPGKLDLRVTYALNDQNELTISYEAVTDKATPVNLTNHAYFNLAGAGADTVLDHELTIYADKYTPTDDTLIPTGKIEPVAATPLDFTKPTRIGARIDKLVDTAWIGYDHNYVVRKDPKAMLSPAAKLRDPASGRVMTVLTTEPGVQLYTGNFLKGQKGKGGKVYAKRSALCLETQHFPDSVNRPEFPSIILKPGNKYSTTTAFKFSAE